MHPAPEHEDEKIRKLLANLWRKNLSTLKSRLDLLDRASSEASRGLLADALREEARSIAHKLSGSLGMFGYSEGTILAGQIELLLKQPVDAEAEAERLHHLVSELRRSLTAGL